MEKSGNFYIEEAESDFKKVHKSIIQDKDIDCLTLGIYVKILVLGKTWQLNIKGLSSYFGLSDMKIRRSISLLEKKGYIARKPIQDESTGKMSGWVYIVYAKPLKQEERTCAGLKTEYPENRQHGYPTTRLSDNAETGGLLNNRLKEDIDLKEYNRLKEQKENEDKSSFEKADVFQPQIAAEPQPEYGIKDWKKDFDEYKLLVEEAKEKLLSDEAFKQKMLKYYPNMDYELSIDKSITTYWGTEEGWNNKRAKRSKQINMLSTLKKNLDKSIVYKPKQNQAQAYKKETQEEYNMKLLRLPYEDKENGTLIDGTFVKGGYRYYHSQLNNKAVSCAMDAPERPDDRYEWDYRKNEWYLPYQLRTAADELW